MTETARPSAGTAGPDRAGGASTPLAIGAIVLAVLGALIYFGSGERPLERSATGFNGLVAWLKAHGVEARSFERGLLVEGQVALRILPLYDTDLEAPRTEPEAREEVIAQTSEKDLERHVLLGKIRSLPTLVVLPKWRTGMRALGVAHADLLIPEAEMNRLLGQIGLGEARIRRDPEGFTTRRHGLGAEAFEIGLLHAQGLRGTGCAPVIGPADAPLLVHCAGRPAPERSLGESAAKPAGGEGAPTVGGGGAADGKAGGETRRAEDGSATTKWQAPGHEFWLLADPDLWNNHGLAHAANGAALLAFVGQFDPARPVIVDLTVQNLTVAEDWRAERYERSWEDFSRMFAWPFTMIWIGFGFVGLLVLWRAVTRYGPTARVEADEPRAAKEVSIDAKARLLRLAGHDVELLQSHVKARLAHLAAELFGARRPAGRAPLDLVTAFVARTRPELARELAAAARIPDREPDPLGRLDHFENCYDRIRHDLGRAESPR